MAAVKEARLVPEGTLYKIEWVGGGQIPKALSGRYTSTATAIRAIEDYDRSKPNSTKPKTKRKVNGPSEAGV